jgi:tRNA-specific 2-thiouridylase
VLVALSGGIDSAVSAYLLIKQGFEVEGAFMKNWTSQEGLLKNKCPWLEDRRDALRVAGFLGIKLHTLDFEQKYQNTVMKYFFSEYKAGRTPNPDVMCNKEIKFKLLYNWARHHGFDYLATGHYAKIGISEKRIENRNGHLSFSLSFKHYSLIRSKDEFKDQTYFIYNIKTEQLPHLLFPIGGMKKTAVRELARKIKLPNAERKESMGLCFVGKIRLKDFLQQKIKAKKGEIVLVSKPPLVPPLSKGGRRGKVLDERGRVFPPVLSSRPLSRDPELKNWIPDNLSDALKTSGMTGMVIGQHQGLHNYTIGQRQGIQVGGQGGPYFVLGKDLKTNTLLVTNDPKDPRLLVKEVQLHSVNWINMGSQLTFNNLQLTGRYRHQGELVPLTLSYIEPSPPTSPRLRRASRPSPKGRGGEVYRVIFKHPQKAVASGQSLVLYKGKECVGGGVIG